VVIHVALHYSIQVRSESFVRTVVVLRLAELVTDLGYVEQVLFRYMLHNHFQLPECPWDNPTRHHERAQLPVQLLAKQAKRHAIPMPVVPGRCKRHELHVLIVGFYGVTCEYVLHPPRVLDSDLVEFAASNEARQNSGHVWSGKREQLLSGLGFDLVNRIIFALLVVLQDNVRSFFFRGQCGLDMSHTELFLGTHVQIHGQIHGQGCLRKHVQIHGQIHGQGCLRKLPLLRRVFYSQNMPEILFRPGPVANLRLRGVFDLPFPCETIFYAKTTQIQCDTQTHNAIPAKTREGQFVHGCSNAAYNTGRFIHKHGILINYRVL